MPYAGSTEENKINNRRTGSVKEQLAADYLTQQGMQIVERNFRGRQGEIDIIGYHKGYLVFVEVKYRSSTVKGTALEAVNAGKQKQICKVADYYRYLHKVSDNSPIRYDVVAIQGESITWIPNAFPHVYNKRGWGR